MKSSLKLMLEEAAERYQGKMAIVSGNLRLSYAELDEASNKLANALINMGVNRGDRVAMLMSNSPEFVITYFGIVKTGAIAVPLDPQYRLDELSSLFASSLPKVLVSESPTLEALMPVLYRFQSIKHIIDLSSERPGQCFSYRQIMAVSPALRIEAEPEPEDIAQIVYTSGSSFYPRGVMLSHRSLATEAAISGDGFQQTAEDIMMLFALPMHHVLGLVAVMLASIDKGSTVVMVPGTGLSIGSFLAAIEKERGTVFLGVPYIFALAVEMAEKEGIKSDLNSLRLCVSCGAPLPVDIIRRFKRHYGFDILDCFGLTEAVCHVSCPSLNGKGRLGSVGKALPGWEIGIVDDNDRELPPNQAGEIVIKGPIMRGYYGNPEATAEVIRGGWLHTGDIGRIDRDGYLFITGRKKETIIVKGQNIHPGDIERVLCTHPKVAEAAVFGIPDEMRGEVVGAVVRLREGEVATELEMKQFCLERIASYKVPKQVVFLDSLPRTADAEIDKESIRARLSIPPLFQR